MNQSKITYYFYCGQNAADYEVFLSARSSGKTRKSCDAIIDAKNSSSSSFRGLFQKKRIECAFKMVFLFFAPTLRKIMLGHEQKLNSSINYIMVWRRGGCQRFCDDKDWRWGEEGCLRFSNLCKPHQKMKDCQQKCVKVGVG